MDSRNKYGPKVVYDAPRYQELPPLEMVKLYGVRAAVAQTDPPEVLSVNNKWRIDTGCPMGLVQKLLTVDYSPFISPI